MSGLPPCAELDLITQSIENANSKIRFFRVAYGKAAVGTTLARAEVASILDDYFRGARLGVVWHPMQELQRRNVKLAFLAIQCLETALPYGGDIDIRVKGSDWSLSAQADKLSADLGLFDLFDTPHAGPEPQANLGAEHVHFAMLAMLTQWRKPPLTVHRGVNTVEIRF